MNDNDLINILKELKEKSKKRKFTQSIDIAVNMTQIDLKKPQNKFTEEIRLPKGRGRDVKVAVIGDSLVVKSKGIADGLINDKALSDIEADKKAMRKMISTYDFFIAEAPFMIRIGKSLGRFMAPKGKMPKPMPPQADPIPMIKMLKNTVRAALQNNYVIHCPIGNETMSNDDLVENFRAIMQAIEKRLPNGRNNIKTVYIKTTMSQPVKINY